MFVEKFVSSVDSVHVVAAEWEHLNWPGTSLAASGALFVTVAISHWLASSLDRCNWGRIVLKRCVGGPSSPLILNTRLVIGSHPSALLPLTPFPPFGNLSVILYMVVCITSSDLFALDCHVFNPYVRCRRLVNRVQPPYLRVPPRYAL